jgi:hypothetical protein
MGGYRISSGTLTNGDNRIQGAGGFSNIAVNNQSAGVINANTGGQTLSFTAGAPSTTQASSRPATAERCNSAGATLAAARPM